MSLLDNRLIFSVGVTGAKGVHTHLSWMIFFYAVCINPPTAERNPETGFVVGVQVKKKFLGYRRTRYPDEAPTPAFDGFTDTEKYKADILERRFM
jgi:hypothetical protein